MKNGLMSSQDFLWEMYHNNIFIHPFNHKNLTEVGYNLSPSDFVFSTRKGMLLEVIRAGSEKYVWIPANDTVLILSREFVSLSNRIAGSFHSRVRVVSQGFGHLSTTLDPGWFGPLLFALNNPSSKKKFYICKDSSKGVQENTLVTMVLFYLSSEATTQHDNLPFRFDILEQWYYSSSWSRRRFNKSFILLDEIISTAKSMSPDKYCSENDLPILKKLDELHAYLANQLDVGKDNRQSIVKSLHRLKYYSREISDTYSEVFTKQFKNCYESQEEKLFSAVNVLMDGCFFEKRRICWDRYSASLIKKISGYRTNRLLWTVSHIRENKNLYTVIAFTLVIVCVILIRLRNTTDVQIDLAIAIVSALVISMFSMIISIFARRD